MPKRILAVSSLLLLFLIVLLFSSSKEGSSGRSMNVYMSGLPTKVDIADITTLNEWTLAANLFRRLFDGISDGQLRPNLAKRWEILADSNSLELEIVEGRFSDGTKITAEDVAWTFTYLAHRRGPNKLPLTPSILECGNENEIAICRSIIVRSDSELSIQFKSPAARVLPILSIPDFGILPKSLARTLLVAGRPMGLADLTVTSGDYYLHEVGTSLSLVKNPFANHEGPATISLREHPSPTNPRSALSDPLAVLREPVLDAASTETPELPDGFQDAVSAPFWVRVGIFPNEQLGLDERKAWNQVLSDLLPPHESSHQLIPGWPKAKAPAESKSTLTKIYERRNILISRFSLNEAQINQLRIAIQKFAPNSALSVADSPRLFIETLRQRSVDVGLAQISYGLHDPLPGLEYMRSVFLNNASSESLQKAYLKVISATTLDERRNAITEYADQLQSDFLIVGLGHLPARIIFPKGFNIAPRFLITGELTFSSFKNAN